MKAMAKVRLDAILLQRGLYPSKSAANAAVLAGAVKILDPNFRAVLKPGHMFDESVELEVTQPAKYVSRGGIKLENALANFDVQIAGKQALDIGSSTGGFTDCLLQRDAKQVVCVDVGYGELAWKLRSDERVTVIERFNARNLQPEDLPYSPQIVTVDVSFISLTKILPAIARVCSSKSDVFLMVKPQFEVGREHLSGSAVVTDREQRVRAVGLVASAAIDLGMTVKDVAPTDLPGPKGNRETFLHLHVGYGDHASTFSAEELDKLLQEKVF